MAQTFEPVARTVLTSGTTQINLTGLSGLGYTDFELHLYLLSSDNRTAVYQYFNGDNNAWAWEYMAQVGGTASVGNSTSDNWIRIGFSAQGNSVASFHVIQMNNVASSDWKSVSGIYGATWANSSTGQYSQGIFGGTYRSTNAISSISIYHTTMQAGTVAALYGIKAS